MKTCPACGHELLRDNFYRVNGVPKCGKCRAELPFDPGRDPASLAQGFEPVLIFEDAAGNVRFPGSSSDPVPVGFEKRELRTITEVRKFEGRMNRHERERWEQHQQAEEAAFNGAQRERRGELLQEMQHMSPFGRDFARYAMEENDRRGGGSFDPGFRISVFSDNASNREDHRSERTEWKRRRA